MKKCLTLIFAVAALISAAVSLPEKWDVEFFKLDEKGFLKGLKVGKNPQKIALSEQVIDLMSVSKGADNAAIRGFIDSDKPQTVWLGVGCKVFSLSLNGKLIYDFREYGLSVINDFKALCEKTEGKTVSPVNYEGVRVNFNEASGDGWQLLRMSVHEPLLVLNCESNKEGGVNKMLTFFKAFIEKYDKLDLSKLVL